MKNFLFIILSLWLFASADNSAQDKGFGLGIIVGEPTGFSGKYWIDESHALDFGLAYSFAHPVKTFSLHADYVIHNESLIHSTQRLPVYYGAGGRIHFGNGDGNTLGVRGVAGIAWLVREVPVDIFFELAPVFNLFPSTSLHLDFAFGGRYYFGK